MENLLGESLCAKRSKGQILILPRTKKLYTIKKVILLLPRISKIIALQLKTGIWRMKGFLGSTHDLLDSEEFWNWVVWKNRLEILWKTFVQDLSGMCNATAMAWAELFNIFFSYILVLWVNVIAVTCTCQASAMQLQ